MTKGQITVKDWLRQIRGVEARVRAKEAQIERFRSLAMRAGVGSFEATRVSGTGNRSRVETGVLDCMDADADIAAEIRDMLRMRKDVAFVIEQIQDTRLRTVLDMYYLTGWTWPRIADEMGFDIRWVHVLHGKALNEVRRILSGYPRIVHCYSLSDCGIV